MSESAAPDRFAPVTHAYDGDLVVFQIGMTIKAPHRPDLWGPVFFAMPRMIDELAANRDAAARGEADDLGFLGSDYLVGVNGPRVMQFWRDADSLYAYAHESTRVHLPAWRAFNKAVRKHPGAVGIWHETYVVPAGGIETFYGNGARVGLGRVTGVVPIGRRGRTARERMGRTLRSA